jgi:hypothetical protein
MPGTIPLNISASKGQQEFVVPYFGLAVLCLFAASRFLIWYSRQAAESAKKNRKGTTQELGRNHLELQKGLKLTFEDQESGEIRRVTLGS